VLVVISENDVCAGGLLETNKAVFFDPETEER